MPQASAIAAVLCSVPPEAMNASSTAISTTFSSVGVEGGDGEAAIGVEHAGIERDQRHEGEIRQRDAREQHGEREFLGIAG